jgi:hypothetical protein
MTELGRQWKELSDEEKRPYKEQFDENMVSF